MIHIGVDFHPEFQQIAWVDTESGEFQEQRLAHREDAEKFYRGLAAAGQKVLVCQYGPRQTQSTQGFMDYSFWYPSPPPDVMKYMLSTYGHPFMKLGLISITKCPSTAAGAEQLFRQRFN